MISLALRQLGYRITAFDNSIEALESFQKTPETFDLVITDMTMPNMTGLTLSKEIRKIRADVPIIICTGYSDQINEKKCKIHNIQGYIMKPVGKKELSETIRNVLDKPTGVS
jgi:CheY-like chemotaxis protein